MRKKIVFFLGSLSGGGAERVVCNLANHLVAVGASVEIVTLGSQGKSYPLDSRVSVRHLLRAGEGRSRLRRWWLRFRRFADYIGRLEQEDVLVALLEGSIIMTLLLRGKTKARIVVSERNYPELYPCWKQWLLRWLARRADGWVFQTEAARRWYGDSVGRAQSVVIPNAVNADSLALPFEGERRKTVVSVGRLAPQKNQRLLIEAFARVSERHPDYTLEVYGDGPLRGRLESLAEEFGVASHVRFMGFVKDVGERIRSASLFVLSSDFEGIPNALMEAMSVGLPCISTRCGGGGAELLIRHGENGLLTDRGSVSQLAEAIDRLLSSPDEALRLGANAVEICRDFAPEKIYNAWTEFLNKRRKDTA